MLRQLREHSVIITIEDVPTCSIVRMGRIVLKYPFVNLMTLARLFKRGIKKAAISLAMRYVDSQEAVINLP